MRPVVANHRQRAMHQPTTWTQTIKNRERPQVGIRTLCGQVQSAGGTGTNGRSMLPSDPLSEVSC